MSANIEVKARISNPRRIEKQLRTISGGPVAMLHQEDLFFSVPRGRLKMRCESPANCELIYYRRPNELGPTLSSYFRQPIENPETKRKELSERFGIQGIVRKKRRLFIIEGARIHLDNVKGIGHFIEIEVPVKSSPDRHRATTVIRRLMKLLAINQEDLLPNTYEEIINYRGNTDKKD